ncbi:CmcJ/NvfI family oxidoreductase [Bradyrhizobium sp. INPA03-11B]|uniref:CmcJ/NvfI family oxidoreductase n=1 Tax=Bradyrhizobium sp. INPA03-11B TaxID=418598 RepID=UPI00338EE23E
MGNAKQGSPTAQVNRDHLECVQGQINFARRSSDENAPEVDLSRLLPNMMLGQVHDLPPMLSYDVTVRNARPIVNELSLDREGFTLIQHKISRPNERDPETIYDRYLEEMVPFIKSYFNASWVVPRRLGIIFRSADGSSIPAIKMKQPIVYAHVDYPPIMGPIIAAMENQSRGIPIQSYSRLMIIQSWHVLSPPPQDFPLAICDGTSVHDTDIHVFDNTVAGTNLKLGAVHFNPAQRWYYFPEMTADELMLFKGYDSEVHCNPNMAHSAFDNRRAYPNAKPRESLEVRFLVYYA